MLIFRQPALRSSRCKITVKYYFLSSETGTRYLAVSASLALAIVRYHLMAAPSRYEPETTVHLIQRKVRLVSRTDFLRLGSRQIKLPVVARDWLQASSLYLLGGGLVVV